VPIHILPEDVAAAIAAGEVVERPESVVKELLENSLDAGARRVEVRIEGGGQEVIEVADDGHGMGRQELPLAVARFATSKLSSKEDLFAIATLGFRGEALSSIGAVSRLEIVSRREGEDAGGRLRMEGGKEPRVAAVGAPKGTVVRVRDLFFNVPARRKFLKSEATEKRRISSLIGRYAVAYPQVAFKLEMDGRVTLQTSGRGDRREAVGVVYGLEMARGLIWLEAQGDGALRLEGMISPPSIHRKSRKDLTFFVNGRPVQDSSLSAAALQAYHGLLMVGRYPFVFLLLQLPPDQVDVNVHPTKTEVRFRDASFVFRVVQRSIRAQLLGQAPPALELGSLWTGGQEPMPQRAWAGPSDPASQVEGEAQMAAAQQPLPREGLPLLRAVGQVGGSYLVAEGPDGLYLIDQHAAHERVLFESLMAALGAGQVQAQRLLAPETVTLAPGEAALLEQWMDVLLKLGYELEPFGPRSYRLRAIPALLSHMAPSQALRAALEDLEDEKEDLLGEELEARIAARVCKRGAVKSGQVLALAEQERLIRDLERCQWPRTCPHGRPTMIHVSVEALERQFGRRG